MLAEKIIFTILAFPLFVYIFFNMVRKNDTNYVTVMLLQSIGILISFLELIFLINMNWFIKFISYFLAIIIPITILILEYKNIKIFDWIKIFQAKCYLMIGNKKVAKEILIQLMENSNENYLAHKMLGKIYESEGGIRKAIDEYAKAVELNKKDYDTYYRISFLLNDLGKKDDAMVMLNNLLKVKPEYFDATRLLGDILCEKEDYKEALNVYNQALKYNSGNYEIYYELGIVYTMLNDFKNAKTCYDKATNINNLLYNGYYNLGQISLLYNELEEAEQYFLKSVYSDAIEPEAYFKLAKIYMALGDNENAIRFVNVSIELDWTYYKKADEENIFNPIKKYLNFRTEDDEPTEKYKKATLNPKEIKANEHLDKTYEVSDKLNTRKSKPVKNNSSKKVILAKSRIKNQDLPKFRE